MKKMKEYKYHIGLNLRIYPSDKQKKIIKMNGGASRYIYNKLVADNNEMYELKKTTSFSFADKDRLEFLQSVHSSKSNMLVMIPFLTQKEIDSDMIDNAIQNYKMAWNQFRKVKGTSVPTFHKRDNTYSYKTSNHYKKVRDNGLKDGSIYFIDNNHINLPKIGKIRFKGSKKLLNKILNFDNEIRLGSVSIEMDNLGLCYISISLASDCPFHNEYVKTNSSLGIDLNLSNFLVDSYGNITDSPEFLKKSEEKLKKEQRKLSRKYEASKKGEYKYYECKNYNEQRLKVAKLY
ncbi:MAG: transposase, partial [Erysipelotrichaceae bacterium]|nr:transposase [Erysipelotrichaceae bacterium]